MSKILFAYEEGGVAYCPACDSPITHGEPDCNCWRNLERRENGELWGELTAEGVKAWIESDKGVTLSERDDNYVVTIKSSRIDDGKYLLEELVDIIIAESPDTVRTIDLGLTIKRKRVYFYVEISVNKELLTRVIENYIQEASC